MRAGASTPCSSILPCSSIFHQPCSSIFDHPVVQTKTSRQSLTGEPQDESGRLTVVMEGKDCPKTSDLVTGVIMGMVGVLSEEGSFIVEGVCYPGIPPQV